MRSRPTILDASRFVLRMRGLLAVLLLGAPLLGLDSGQLSCYTVVARI